MMPSPRTLLFLLPAALLGLLPGPGFARPAYKKALADLLGLPSASRLNDCRTCHSPDKPGASDSEKPHNSFGLRLKALRAEYRKAGKPDDITARILACADEDSDGDGSPNLLELVTGHNPGDGTDRPTSAEIERGKSKQIALLESLRNYRWKPFDRVERPALPAVKNPTLARNAIDYFVQAEQDKRGLTPRPDAPHAVLLRRVHLDLIGLPPTSDELEAFLADRQPDAYEKVVDHLLASPAYGERWGRHWMDIWRYSDWAGFGAQVRDSQPHIWHWRDWIIDSLNADKGYDRMVQEMLAGDELAPTDTDALRATGFLVRNYKLLSREKWLQDVVDHSAGAFLGLTLGCARCHDHMYDPITQKEYYQVRAIFTPHNQRTDRVPGEMDIKKAGLPRAYDAELTTATYLLIRGDDRTPDKAPLPPGVPESLGGKFGPVAPVSLPLEAWNPDQRAFVSRDTIAAGEQQITQAREGLTKARQSAARAVASNLESQLLLALTRLAALEPLGGGLELAHLEVQLAEARQTTLLAQLKMEKMEGQGVRMGETWTAAAVETNKVQSRQAVLEARKAWHLARSAELQALPPARAAAKKKTADAEKALTLAEMNANKPATSTFTRRASVSYPSTSTGRRLAFARWLTQRENPLAARVAVNHLWLRHFGQALAPSVFDFGRNGQAPTHPALLDWLAVEFMERGWSMKDLHRLIVTSATYRRDSTPDSGGLERDADNQYLWRFAPRRLEAEAVRDTIYHVAGRLDRTPGGPDIDQNLGLTVPRRSLYFRHAAEKQMEFLLLFDAASVTECYQRKHSILPQQALALVNSDLVIRHGRILARSLAARTGPDAGKFTEAAFAAVLSRRPRAEEKTECVTFLETQAVRLPASKGNPIDAEGILPAGEPMLRARENLVQVLLNHHEFVTIR